MSKVKLAALVLSVALLAGCGNSLNLTARSHRETQWLGTFRAAHIASGPLAHRMAARIRKAVRESGATLVRLRIYSLPELAPSVVLVAPRPAHFLGEPLQHVFQSYGGGHYGHLLVLDPFGRFVFENFFTGNGGSAYFGPGYEGCSPGYDEGLGVHPCRKDAWPYG